MALSFAWIGMAFAMSRPAIQDEYRLPLAPWGAGQYEDAKRVLSNQQGVTP
jgi:hypothetical protein